MPISFQSTHPQGVRHINTEQEDHIYDISIHAPTRGATNVLEYVDYDSPISIHAPTRGATAVELATKRATKISIHAPTRGATTSGRRKKSTGVNFNPRTHKGCDYHDETTAIIDGISIHAPTRGATTRLCKISPVNHYFNPPPPKGCALCSRHNLTTLGNFNPRTHKGCDDWLYMYQAKYAISIHAPTRGATQIKTCGASSALKFQSTHPQGVRRIP